MLKLVRINKGKTIYSVLDTETGNLTEFSRMELMDYAYENEVLGVNVNHASMKSVREIAYVLEVRSWRNFMYALQFKFGKIEVPINIEISSLHDEEEIMLAKMLYFECEYIKNLFFTLNDNTLNLYMGYDRILVPKERVDTVLFDIYPFPYKIGEITNGGKFVLEDGTCLFQYFKNRE